MALALLTTTAFERDLRRVEKQGKDLDKLEAVVDLLQAQKPLPARCPAPSFARGLVWTLGLPCRGGLAPAVQSHSNPVDPVRTGSHAELFR
jgi:mRNA-degrading endonuclease YafQ of YafQ-DinJ toxin-antitoxin module